MERPLTPEEQKAWKEFCSRNRKLVPADTPSLNDWHYFRPDDVESLFLSSLRNEKKVKKYRSQTITYYPGLRESRCDLCECKWRDNSPESHADGCLNEQEKEK